MPNISDVARAAGVGIGTVSRVLNGSPLVSEATRQRVVAAMERLRYQPSPIARAFGRRRTHTFDLLVPLIAQAFFLEILRGIEDVLAQTDYRLVTRTIETGQDRERVFDECCARGRSDGVLLVWAPPTQHFVQRMADAAVPIVLVNAVEPTVWSVAVDHDAAAAQAVTYCVGLGHRRIALIDRPQDPFAPDGPGVCQGGYRAALTASDVSVPDGYEQMAELETRGGAAALDALLALPETPTAALVASDAQALGVLESARTRGIRVPRELSIIGYNDNPVVEYLGLTTVKLPLRELGRHAASLLLSVQSEPNASPTTTYLPTQLVVRGTCAPPAQ